ncbi:hypothetical protein H0H87_002723 [Tephrocybe sp. NHM501043]|nr:hypothetical protein H0H87_002723 [Tephrocybe sp. NHM501043]
MLPLRGLGLRRCLALLLTLHVAFALELVIPPVVQLGEAIQVYWTPADGDPPIMKLFLSCDSGLTAPIMIAEVPTAPASSTVVVPSTSYEGQNLIFPVDNGMSSNSDIVLNEAFTAVNAANTTTTTAATSILLQTTEPSSATDETLQQTTSTSTYHRSSQTTSQTTSSQTSTSSSTATLSDTTYSPSAQPTSTVTHSLSPAVSSASPLAPLPTSANPSTAAAKTNLSAIIGGVIGGVLVLLIIALLVFLCRRRRRQTRCVSILRDAQLDPSSMPFTVEKEQALVGLDAEAMLETGKIGLTGQHNRSGSSSLGHYSDGHRSPETVVEGKLQPVRYSDNPINRDMAAIPMKVYNGEEWRNHHEPHRPGSSSSTESSIRERLSVPPGAIAPLRFSPLMHMTEYDEASRPSSADVIDVENMDPEARERRREAILEQMRRVLDGEKN